MSLTKKILAPRVCSLRPAKAAAADMDAAAAATGVRRTVVGMDAEAVGV
jgi:hypothetical protein